MKKAFISIVGIALLAASAYAQMSIGGVRWELTELNGKRSSNSRAYIEFEEAERRFTGNAGCNRMFGSYEREGTHFKANNIGTTRMACTGNGTARQEAAFLEALKKANRIRRSGTTLSISSASGVVLKFQRAKRSNSGQAAELTAKKWMLRSVNGNSVDLTKNPPFLNFDASKGSAGGHSGCNSFGGDYEVTGSSIKFGDMIQTMMACGLERRMEIERGLMDGLRNAYRYEIRGNRLTLFRGNRAVLIFEGISK